MIYFGIAAVIFFADLLIKNRVEKKRKLGESKKVLKGHLILTRYHNEGAFLNFMEKQKEVLLIISGIMLGVILTGMFFLVPQKGKKIVKLAMALLTGGALSNVYDRVFRGYVVDYFSFSFLERVIFNISDMFIFIGSAIMLVWYGLS